MVEYAPFQGLIKSRARKDKHVGTIENEQHFQNFLESLKAEESENQKSEGKLFSFQLKDDKKITSTPLLEFLAAAKEEKREAKKKKVEEKKKQREEDKQRKKKEVTKNIPEPIKESKEEVVYDDGVVVRTVPSRLGRNDKNPKKENDKDTVEKDRREKRGRDREERKKNQREKEEKRRQERDLQKAKDRQARENDEKKSETQTASTSTNATPAPEESSKQPPKREVKRYSELRKARQEKTGSDSKEINEEQSIAEKDVTGEQHFYLN